MLVHIYTYKWMGLDPWTPLCYEHLAVLINRNKLKLVQLYCTQSKIKDQRSRWKQSSSNAVPDMFCWRRLSYSCKYIATYIASYIYYHIYCSIYCITKHIRGRFKGMCCGVVPLFYSEGKTPLCPIKQYKYICK